MFWKPFGINCYIKPNLLSMVLIGNKEKWYSLSSSFLKVKNLSKSASFQTNQVERENHKPRPTSIQCSSIILMHFFLLFAKLGTRIYRVRLANSYLINITSVPKTAKEKLVKLQGFTDLLASIKTDRFTCCLGFRHRRRTIHDIARLFSEIRDGLTLKPKLGRLKIIL